MKKHRNVIKRDIERLKDDLAITAKNMADQARDKFVDSYESVKDKSTDLQGSVEHYVVERPFKSIALAALTGFIFAVAMRKKRKLYR